MFRSALALLSLLTVSCTSDSDPLIDPDRADSLSRCDNAFEKRDHPATMTVAPPGEFDFCLNQDGLNLNNARWLAFLATAEYAHFGYSVPVLGDLGFGNTESVDYPGVSEAEYFANCVDGMYWLRCANDEENAKGERVHPARVDWPHECTRRWAEPQEGELDEIPDEWTPAADFERWLVSGDHPDWKIDFISGGEFEHGIEGFGQTSTQLVWLEHGTQPVVIVSFRGTESIDDFKVDAQILQKWFNPNDRSWGQVHGGLQGALREAATEVSPNPITLLEAKFERILESRPNTEIWITGHSLGAGLATLLAAELFQNMATKEGWNELNFKGLATFGSLRPGDQNFADKFNEQAERYGTSVQRFVHGKDLVTGVPKDFGILGSNYVHVGDVVYLGKEDGALCPNGNGPCLLHEPDDNDTLADKVNSHRGFFGNAGDHGIQNYYDRLAAQYDNTGSACP